MKRLLSISLILITCFGVSVSCQRNEEVVPTSSSSHAITYNDGVAQAINGIPMYRDLMAFTQNILKHRTDGDRLAFESKFNFSSLLTNYLAAKSANNLTNADHTTSALIYTSQDGTVELDAISYDYASAVNKNGLVIVGGYMHKFTQDHVFSLSLMNGINLAKAAAILTSSDPASQSKQVVVNIVHSNNNRTNDKAIQSVNPGNHYSYGYAEINQGEYNSFYVNTKLTYGWVPLSDGHCTSSHYDADCGCLQCDSDNDYVTDDYYTQSYIVVQEIGTRRHCETTCYTTNLNGGWVNANNVQGSFDYIYQGSSHHTPFNYSTLDSDINYTVFLDVTQKTSYYQDSDFQMISGQADTYTTIQDNTYYTIKGTMHTTLVP